jgi:2-polyprenyl-6-methoxyphenol hydroxylase-like FAD-dependent oxidoreductase
MKIAVVGIGTAGSAAALLLARDGHEVHIFERVSVPRGIGAGILLQGVGQRVLDELGLADELERLSTPVRRIDARTKGGRRVLDFGYDDVLPGAYGWGVHRGTLFELLCGAVRTAGIPTTTGLEVRGLTQARDGWRLTTDRGDQGPFDLVVGADGARSRIRHVSGLATKDVGYPYGAIWSVVPDPEHLAGDALIQRYGDTRIILGVLPMGVGQASLFWSVPTRRLAAAVAAGPAAWVETARPFAAHLAPLVERAAVEGILEARYRDVVVRSPVVVRGGFGLALIGDAAHAMSPQIGLGASLALADAWSLASSLRRYPRNLALALQSHADGRRAHVRYYTWCSRFMTPVFQSDLVPIGWGRDALLGPIGRIPWVRRQFVTTLMGIRTSPWSLLDGQPQPAAANSPSRGRPASSQSSRPPE